LSGCFGLLGVVTQGRRLFVRQVNEYVPCFCGTTVASGNLEAAGEERGREATVGCGERERRAVMLSLVLEAEENRRTEERKEKVRREREREE
jgi:hypothetical protein